MACVAVCGCTLATTTVVNTNRGLANFDDDHPGEAQLGWGWWGRMRPPPLPPMLTPALNKATAAMAAASKAAAAKEAAVKEALAKAEAAAKAEAVALNKATDAMAAANKAAAEKTQMSSPSGCQASIKKAEIRLKKVEAALRE